MIIFSIFSEMVLQKDITKDEYAFTLRENEKACNEMKSGNREGAKVLAQEERERQRKECLK